MSRARTTVWAGTQLYSGAGLGRVFADEGAAAGTPAYWESEDWEPEEEADWEELLLILTYARTRGSRTATPASYARPA